MRAIVRGIVGMVTIGALVWPGHAAHPTFEPSPSEFTTFLGDRSGVLVYTSSGDDAAVYFVAVDGSTFAPKRICDGASAKISSDGTRVLYTNSGALYIRSLVENSPDSDRRRIAEGTDRNRHYWWIHPSTHDEYVIYCRRDHGIYCQKLDSESRPDGAATRLFSNWTANGGRSGDGRFLATTGTDPIPGEERGIYEITPAAAVENATQNHFVTFAGDAANGVVGGFCYGYMSPSGASDPFYGCLAHLVGGHYQIHIRRFDAAKSVDSTVVRTFNAPNFTGTAFDTVPPYGDGYTYNGWEMPVWSTHPEYLTAYGSGKKKVGSGTEYADHAFVFNLTTGEYLRITNDTSDVSFSHLWINSSGSGDPAVVAVIQATPSRGTVPLTVSFDARSSTGRDVSYAWTYGDGGSGAGAEVSHEYTAAGTYTARLVVTSGTTSDTATTEIVVDAQPAVAAKIELTPSGTFRIVKGRTVDFVAKVLDEDDTEMPDEPVTWSVSGNGGGTIGTSGEYRAGGTAARTDTVIATSGSAQGRCVVTIVDDPMRFVSSHDGRTYAVGDTITIRYETDTLFVTQISIWFTPDSGETMVLISDPGAAINHHDTDWGTFIWVVPDKAVDAAHPEGVSTITNGGGFVLHDYGNSGYPDEFTAGAFAVRSGSPVLGGASGKSGAMRTSLVARHGGYLLHVGGAGPFSLTVFDATGRARVSRGGSAQRSMVLSNADLAPGCYIVRVKTPSEVFVRRFYLAAP